MSKYCKAYKLRVTYLDCMECETKECRKTTNASMEEQKQEEIAKYVQSMVNVNLQKGKNMIKRYLQLEPEQKVFLVFASKREGYKENIVIRCKVKECTVRKDTVLYILRKEKIVTGQKNIKSFIDNFMCKNANIDTGYRGMQGDIYPVFTTKEKCIEWLKG